MRHSTMFSSETCATAKAGPFFAAKLAQRSVDCSLINIQLQTSILNLAEEEDILLLTMSKLSMIALFPGTIELFLEAGTIAPLAKLATFGSGEVKTKALLNLLIITQDPAGRDAVALFYKPMENAAQAVFEEKCTLEVKPDLVSIKALMQMQPFQPYLPYPELAISMVHNYESATPSPPATPATPSTPPRPDFGRLDETQKEADPEELYLCFPKELFISSDKVSGSESAAFSNMHTDHETQEYVYDGLDAQDDECMEASQTTLGFAQVPREQGVAPRNAGEGIKGSDTLSNDMDNRKISVENDKILDVPSAPVRQLRKRWSDIEDLTLYRALSYYGDRAWPKVSRALPGRTGKQCRERWRNHLRSGLFKGDWTLAEKQRLDALYQVYGSKWATIAKFLPGRTDSAVKNFWHRNNSASSLGRQS